MNEVTKIKVGNDPERSYLDYPVNEEFFKRIDEPEESSGGERMIVTITNTAGTRTSDKSSEEIAEAYESGMDVIAVMDDGAIVKLHKLTDTSAIFQEINFEIDDERMKLKHVTIEGNSCDYRNRQYLLTEA